MKIKFYLNVRSLGLHRPVFDSCLEKPEKEWLIGFALISKEGGQSRKQICMLTTGRKWCVFLWVVPVLLG